jgi:hypothetical protein
VVKSSAYDDKPNSVMFGLVVPRKTLKTANEINVGTLKPNKITVDDEGCRVQRLFRMFDRMQRHPQTRWPGRGNAGSAAKMNAEPPIYGRLTGH